MKPVIKWPGGKSGEVSRILPLVPAHERYVEPFFGGGALFFALAPERALINDLSDSLMEFYSLVKAQDPLFRGILEAYADGLSGLLALCDSRSDLLAGLFFHRYDGGLTSAALRGELSALLEGLSADLAACVSPALCVDMPRLLSELLEGALDKYERTVVNHRRTPFPPGDLRENIITGFASGFYMYFRGIYNDISLRRRPSPSAQYRAANFYFIREYCYGSMFRYNRAGEFNIPYGGMSYNRKSFSAKLGGIFCPETERLFSGAELRCGDFEAVLDSVDPDGDFVFLDPPYDTRFSGYDGSSFGPSEQQRLADALRRMRAKFIMVIQDSALISRLYRENFRVESFENRYTYNVRSRNPRSSSHLIISNFDPVPRAGNSSGPV